MKCDVLELIVGSNLEDKKYKKGEFQVKNISEYLSGNLSLESMDVEYKSQLNKQDIEGWIKTVVAFANDGGGNLFLGVENNGYISGLTEDEADKEQIYFVGIIKNKIEPQISYTIKSIPLENRKCFLHIYIPEFEDGTVCYLDNSNGQTRERLYRRYPGSTYEVTALKEIIDYKISKDQLPYDTIATKYKADDFTFNSLNERYQDKKGNEGSFDMKRLQSVGLVTQDGYLTKGGLLFCDNSPKQYPLIHMRKWPGYNKGSDDVIDVKAFRGSLIEQLNEAEKFIRWNSKTGIQKRPGGAIDVWAYPPVAITEAIVNALGHRDYWIEGTQIDVDIYVDRIEIVSPGSFLPKGKAQDYEDIRDIPSKRRNSVISNTFEKCGLMQKFGSGFDKIVDAYSPYEVKYQPKVKSFPDWFMITLMDTVYTPENSTYIVIEEEIKLPKNQKKVYEAIKNNPGLRTPKLAELCELSISGIDNATRALRNKNLIEFVGSSATGGYYLKTTD